MSKHQAFRIDGVQRVSMGLVGLTKLTVVTLRRVVLDIGGHAWNDCDDTYTMPVEDDGGFYASNLGEVITLSPAVAVRQEHRAVG